MRPFGRVLVLVFNLSKAFPDARGELKHEA